MIAVDHKDWMEHFKLHKTELGHFRTEYDQFKLKDFCALEARVTALEKRLSALSIQVGGIKMPEVSHSGGHVDNSLIIALENRVTVLEKGLAELRAEFAKWWKQIQD